MIPYTNESTIFQVCTVLTLRTDICYYIKYMLSTKNFVLTFVSIASQWTGHKQ